MAVVTGDGTSQSLSGTMQADTITGLGGDDTLSGGNGTDLMEGGEDNDSLLGGGHSDSLYGGNGNDQLFGENAADYLEDTAGSNTLDGGVGDDTILASSTNSADVNLVTTGDGSDTVVLKAASLAQLTITDFTAGSGNDVLDVSDLLSNSTGYVGGNNPFTGKFLMLVQSGTSTLLQWDKDGTGTTNSWVTVATLQNVTATAMVSGNFSPAFTPAVNAVPVLATAIADQVATEDSGFLFTITAGTFTDADGDTLTYTTSTLPSWLSFNSTTRVFSGTPLNGDVGTASVTVTVSDSSGSTASDTFTITTSNTNDPHTGGVSITGTPEDNATLTANSTLADDDGLGTLNYQWESSTNGTTWTTIAGADDATLVLTDAEVGQVVRVVVSYTDLRGTAESATSSATATVTDVDDDPTGGVTVTGSPVEGATLTVTDDLDDEDGMGTVSYSWSVDGTVVSADDELVLTQAHVGKSISVTASYTDGAGNDESVSEDVTGTVENSNDLPTGGVTISGALTEDATLTVTDDIDDEDGMGIVTYTWTADGTVVDTGEEFVLTQDEVGKSIAVIASYTDVYGEDETVGGSLSGTVDNVDDAPTGGVTISGVVEQGQTLSATDDLDDEDGLGAITYTWFADGTEVGTGADLVLTQDEVGKSISVTASFTDGFGHDESVSADATVTVADIDADPTGDVTISGVAEQGQTLTATDDLDDPDGMGTVTYTWYADGSEVGTGPEYVLTQDEVGKSISVTASFTDGDGNLESATDDLAGTVDDVNDPPTGAVTISGVLEQGQTLSVSDDIDDADGMGAITYTWYADSTEVGTGADLVLTDADVGKSITVTAEYTDGASNDESVSGSASGTVLDIDADPTGDVTITGVLEQGETLTAADDLDDADGMGTVTYTWYADGTEVGTGADYVLTQDEVGKSISVTASFTDGDGNDESASASATGTVLDVDDDPTGGVTITGTLEQGQTLTASDDLDDADGMGPVTYTWYADGSEVGTGADLVLTDAEVGKSISVTASFTDDAGNDESASVAATGTVLDIDADPTGSLTIAGTLEQGQTLTVTDDLDDPDGMGAVTYTWYADATEVGTGSDLVLGDDEVGKSITVVASFDDGDGNSETVEGAATGTVGDIDADPTGGVTITGTATEGQTLTASDDLDDADGMGTVTYTWYADGTQVGTGAEYVLTEDEIGKTIVATATFDDGDGNAESVDSDPTATVAPDINVVTGTGADESLPGSARKDQIDGQGGNDTLQGLEKADTLEGGDGNDVLDGGTGADSMVGGSGNDTYTVDDAGDSVTEGASGGTDTVLSHLASYTLGSDVEHGTVAASAGASVTGNTGDNLLKGNIGNDTLTGGDGDDSLNGGIGIDSLTGGDGNDTYTVNNVGDVVVEADGEGTDTVVSAATRTLGNFVENLTLIGSLNIHATGNALDNVLRGNAGNNRVNGKAGADTMFGGSGNDTYFVDDAGDRTMESSDTVSGGTDRVESTVSHTLQAFVENLTLTGTDAIDGTGNGGANALRGNVADNTLNGRGGADSMYGGNGNDTYYVDDAGDNIIESSDSLNGGVDRVNSSVSFVLRNYMENLTLIGTDSIDGSGNELANVLTGNGADNNLNGKQGADTLVGGKGNDSYVIDDAGDVITESSDSVAGGNDTVTSSISYTLGSLLENLTLSGDAAINAVGNGLANVLRGNDAANELSGKAGADTMYGGAGNDTYFIDDAGDDVNELSDSVTGGYDRVNSSVSYSLEAFVEELALTGTADNNGNGNGLANRLIGNSGDNVLNGRGGVDTMLGGAGDDTYYVETLGDLANDSSDSVNGGHDLVNSSISFTLSTFIEDLTLIGADLIDGTGNARDNVLRGSSLANVLSGLNGNDQLIGNAGNDTLLGGDGADTLRGGNGTDSLTGGIGNDVFDFDSLVEMSTAASERDIVADFAAGDKIDLSSLDANAATIGTDDAFTFLGNTAFSANATGQLRYVVSGSDVVVFGSTDVDTAPEFSILLVGLGSLAGTDFIL